MLFEYTSASTGKGRYKPILYIFPSIFKLSSSTCIMYKAEAYLLLAISSHLSVFNISITTFGINVNSLLFTLELFVFLKLIHFAHIYAIHWTCR